MTRPSRRSSTGSRPRPALALLAAAAFLCSVPAPAGAQSLKLGALDFPPTDVVGPWVSYLVRTQSGSRAAREYTQRVAIVSKAVDKGRPGFWVELKTTGLSSGTRIERGLFVEISASQAVAPDAGDEEGSDAPPPPPPPQSSDGGADRKYRLVRYQVLTPGGKLFEYTVDAASEIRVGGQISTFELFEYEPHVPPITDALGPDTLRSGRRVIPTIVDRTIRLGSDDWSNPGDTTTANRSILIQTYWRNSAVPITGFAKSLFQVASVSYSQALRDSAAGAPPAAADTAAHWSPPDSLLRAAATSPTTVISWTELDLLDLGSDAVPEVTQEPEPLPTEETEPKSAAPR